MFSQNIFDVQKAMLVAGRCLCCFGVMLVWRNGETGSIFLNSCPIKRIFWVVRWKNHATNADQQALV
jgi:hypothetical protein